VEFLGWVKQPNASHISLVFFEYFYIHCFLFVWMIGRQGHKGLGSMLRFLDCTHHLVKVIQAGDSVPVSKYDQKQRKLQGVQGSCFSPAG